MFDYCKGRGLEQTRSRAHKKNDQAWVEQKNGAVVRRLVGYGRLSGAKATAALAVLYTSPRLYINIFQPSFKLKCKTRDGARVKKVYFAPATPLDNALLQPGALDAFARLLKQGWTDTVRKVHPKDRVYPFGTTGAIAGSAMRACRSITCC